MHLADMLAELSRLHFPYPPATPDQIQAFEERSGWRLDPDLRAFYLHCNGAELFERLPETPYRFLPLAEILRARQAIRGKDDNSCGPASLYTLCHLQDNDYLCVDVCQQQNGRYPIIDCWHESFPDYCRQIAGCFSELLEHALRSEGFQFWLRQS